MEIFGGGIRPARKPHACAWCVDWIETGEKHHWWSGVDDGRAWTLRSHEDCDKPLRESAMDDPDSFFCESEGPHQRGEECHHRE